MGTEAHTCRKLITPQLRAAGWEIEPHSIAEQRTFTAGRIVVHGNKSTRRKGKRTDYLLCDTRDFTIAVVEAEAEHKKAAAGMQQARKYAALLNLRFAFATNGMEIIQFDAIIGQPILNVGQLEQTRIPNPPLAEQRQIVAELDALLPAILDKAFKGEV